MDNVMLGLIEKFVYLEIEKKERLDAYNRAQNAANSIHEELVKRLNTADFKPPRSFDGAFYIVHQGLYLLRITGLGNPDLGIQVEIAQHLMELPALVKDLPDQDSEAPVFSDF